MSRQIVFNRRGGTVGFIDTGPDGEQLAVDRAGRALARFNPRTNETLDLAGRLVAEGNLLVGMVRNA